MLLAVHGALEEAATKAPNNTVLPRLLASTRRLLTDAYTALGRADEAARWSR